MLVNEMHIGFSVEEVANLNQESSFSNVFLLLNERGHKLGW